MVAVNDLIRLEQTRWQSCAIHPERQALFSKVAVRLCAPAAKAIYQRIAARTGVPWFVIAVIHERESTQNFDRSIAQGDPWNAVSTHVPKGRGPFKSFEDAAYDALVDCAPKAARWTDWSVGGCLTILEEYNGLGYANKGLPSPYVWAGTNQYIKGKYVADGVFDPEKVDTQLGVAGLLLTMVGIDSTIRFGGTVQTSKGAEDTGALLGQPKPAQPAQAPATTRISPSKPAVPVVPSPSTVPSIGHPAPGSIGDMIAKIFHALFSHV